MPCRTFIRNLRWPAAAGALALLAACGSTNTPAGAGISGTVATPVSTAINQAGPKAGLLGLASPLAATVNTSAPNTTPLGAGIAVKLIQIDGNGAQVGDVIATGTTDASGQYILRAPYGFVPGPSFVVQAAIASGKTLQAFVTSATANIDPYTQTTVALVTGSLAGASPSTLTAADITTVQQTVLTGSGNITLAAGASAADMATALTANVKNDVESSNIVTNLAAATGIAGTVTGPDGAPVAGAQILVRTYGNQITAAMTRTDASGAYTVHVAAGDYIIGAINDTTTSTAASTWWTSSSTPATSQFKAEKVTVASSTLTRNFTLAAGARLAGTITTSDTSQPLAGIVVTLVDFVSGQTLMYITTQPDGTFSFNVAPGTYYVSARNSTLQPYATAVYITGTPTGGSNKCLATGVTLAAGDSKTGAMTLEPGHQISGLVSDPTTGPVGGMVVRFQDASSAAGGAGAESMRTGKDGTYHLWVQPGTYSIFTRGQYHLGLDVTQADQVQNFKAAVGQVDATLQDPSGNPISQAMVYLYPPSIQSSPSSRAGNELYSPDSPFAYNQAQSWEISNSDGTVSLYLPAALGGGTMSSVHMGFMIDDGEMFGTSIYAGTGVTAATEALGSGSAIVVPALGATTSLGTITLPAGAVLSGTVTRQTTNVPLPNIKVQVRMGGISGSNAMFTTRTMSDGTYSLSLPAGKTLDYVIAFPAAGSVSPNPVIGTPVSPNNYAFAAAVQMGAAGTTKTLNFNF